MYIQYNNRALLSLQHFTSFKNMEKPLTQSAMTISHNISDHSATVQVHLASIRLSADRSSTVVYYLVSSFHSHETLLFSRFFACFLQSKVSIIYIYTHLFQCEPPRKRHNHVCYLKKVRHLAIRRCRCTLNQGWSVRRQQLGQHNVSRQQSLVKCILVSCRAQK